jgi:hypothetical protein
MAEINVTMSGTKATDAESMKAKQFKTGTDGFTANFKRTVDGVRYQFDVKAYRIGSKEENIAKGFVPTAKTDAIEA